ncbi:MAG: hypothetical protein JW808_03995 [Victivallales bacterium]|nr:hypothetical protein [Victivallales bacterium]
MNTATYEECSLPVKGQDLKAGTTTWKLVLAFAVLAALPPLVYVMYTGHIWEDFFITFRFSRNLADGLGLVYEPGKRVHGFTSPLGVLIPALCYLAFPAGEHSGALWLFRLFVCIPAFVGGAMFMVMTFFGGIPRDFSKIPLAVKCPAAFASLFYLLEAKAVMFSVNGMETALMLLFCGAAFYLSIDNSGKKWLYAGISWAGLMWTRPDSCFYVAGFMLTTWVCALPGMRTAALKGIVKSAIVTTVLYLPWFVWSWAYYGTPVPHTVTAKGSGLLTGGIGGFLSRLMMHTSWVYQPVYPHFGGWPGYVAIVASCMSFFCFCYWMLSPFTAVRDMDAASLRISQIARGGSVFFFFICLYLGLMSFPYPWYFPPAGMIGCIALPAGLFTLSSKIKNRSRALLYPAAINSIVAVFLAFVLIMSTFQMRIQQQLIENDTRMAAGKWLKDAKSPEDRIFLECLGYIGYFSEGIMLDYPGLCTPEVVRLIKEKGYSMGSVIPELAPEWLVLRPAEVQALHKEPFFGDYELAMEFNSQPELQRIGYIPGKNYLLYDSFFYVFRRQTPGGKEEIEPNKQTKNDGDENE